MSFDLSTQVKFCQLLKYYHHGDYSTFKRAWETVSTAQSKDRFFISNMFTSAQITGLIEHSETERSNWWFVAFERDVVVDSKKGKLIGTTLQSLKRKDFRPLVQDFYNNPILFGADIGARTGYFSSDFEQQSFSLKSVEADVVLEEQFRLDLGQSIEMFDIARTGWYPCSIEQIDRSMLIRSRNRFTGFSYFVVLPDLGLLFKVVQPEWAILVASKILNWNIYSKIQFSKNKIIVPRALRLPILFYRYLFSSCDLLRIGPSIEFEGLSEQSINWFKNYFDRG